MGVLSCCLVFPVCCRSAVRKAGMVHAAGDGPGSGMAWGCDLSYDYVKINAEYTT